MPSMEMPKIIRIGSSKGMVIPHKFCNKLGIKLGQRVECTLNIQGHMIVKVPKQTEDAT